MFDDESDAPIEIDHYIDWALAKDQLLDLHRELISSIRLCDIALQNDNMENSRDLLTAKMTEIFSIGEEQIQQISLVYTEFTQTLKAMSSSLGEGEITNDPNY